MKVSLWAEIRRLHETQRLSKNAIARQLGCWYPSTDIRGVTSFVHASWWDGQESVSRPGAVAATERRSR